ncbi:hypothetical protein B0H10DRAFT_2168045 [Mycena sp. CBHHK59/15]|nr:hypothetical protein B0H10DRAFT_2168045 [Mycena sp. CBHHK59/15]
MIFLLVERSATGFIGFPAAKALVRAGHTVYGFVRDQAKAKFLAAGENLDSDVWTKLIPTLDVIIEAIGGGEVKDLSATAFERTTKAVQEMRPKGAPLLSHIYTPGTWVHGDSRKDTVIDTTPIYRPVELPGTPGGRYAVIHADDLADLYVRAAEKASLIGGKIFDAANPNKQSVDELWQRLVEYTKPGNFVQTMNSPTRCFGWSVKKQGLTDGLENYHAAWLAST